MSKLDDGGISDSEQYTKNAPTLILRNGLVLHVNVVVFILRHKLSQMIFNLVFINIFEIISNLKY